MDRIAWIITIPAAATIVLFAVMNRQPVTLNLWPLPWDISAPVFLLVFCAIVFGFALGAVVTWRSGGSVRQKLREARRELSAHNRQQVVPRGGPGATTGSPEA